MNWLWKWLVVRDRKAGSPVLKIQLYTRSGCHLCDEARRLLNDRRAKSGFSLEIIDVDSDPELAAHHGDWVPVITVNGKTRFRGAVAAPLLDRLLLSETQRMRSGS